MGCNAEFIDDQGVWGKRLMIEVPQKKDFLRTSVFIHPAILVRAEVMQKLGGYSTETCALRTEDYELFMRLYAAGERGYNLQEFLFRYREDVHAFPSENINIVSMRQECGIVDFEHWEY